VPDVPALSRSGGLSEDVLDVFAPDGKLAQTLPAFEPRPGQRTMAAAVAGVLATGGVLLAEAGTGTGKTLAYLIPAILHRKRVLVSTGTKNLQEQIYTKDVPLLRHALGLPFTATYMKGRGNYLCLHRFDQLTSSLSVDSDSSLMPHRPSAGASRLRDGATIGATDRIHLTLIEEWMKRTDTGDRGEIDELPDDLAFWNEIAATTENCLGNECPRFGDCFVTRMRQRAAESDVVIVNHHLLCADAAVRHHSFGEVIPDCHVLVVDEAHQLEEIATQYFGISVSNYRVEELVADAARVLRTQPIPDRTQAKDFVLAVDRVEREGRQFFSDLQWKRPAPAGDALTARKSGGLFDERTRLTEEALDAAGESGLLLTQALDALEGAVRLVKDASDDLQAVGRRSAELRDQLRFLLRIDDKAFVYFLEIRGRGVFLKASPIDVSSIVKELLLDRMHATVLTSATLAVNGSFAYVRGRLGIESADEVRLPSEFDYERQSLLYLPRKMPDPRDATFTQRVGDETIEILRRTEGRAFVLFTSYAAMRAVEARVASALPYPLFVQGAAPRHVLLERFKQTANAVLLATSSFWQGVDVVGEALSCVIIDKLPFASPGDPITAARIESINARGGDAFGEFQVPVAILTLLQGLGRLLRHRSDRGILAILDPRLQTMGYGRRFLASLPPAPITRKLEDIEKFFKTEW
jgi:ATP-dependent DNA helicase DinG